MVESYGQVPAFFVVALRAIFAKLSLMNVLVQVAREAGGTQSLIEFRTQMAGLADQRRMSP